jgi:hypothetical protein
VVFAQDFDNRLMNPAVEPEEASFAHRWVRTLLSSGEQGGSSTTSTTTGLYHDKGVTDCAPVVPTPDFDETPAGPTVELEVSFAHR